MKKRNKTKITERCEICYIPISEIEKHYCGELDTTDHKDKFEKFMLKHKFQSCCGRCRDDIMNNKNPIILSGYTTDDKHDVTIHILKYQKTKQAELLINEKGLAFGNLVDVEAIANLLKNSYEAIGLKKINIKKYNRS